MTSGLTPLDELKLHRVALDSTPDGRRITRSAAMDILTCAFRALADRDAEIARLHAELDSVSEHPVELVTERGLAAAMAADPAREDGAVLRVTDGDRTAWRWQAAKREWEPAQ